MPDYPAEQDGQRDAPNVKIENDTVPLIDQNMWDIEFTEHLRDVTEPYQNENGEQIQLRMLTVRSERLALYSSYRELRARYSPANPETGKFKRMLLAILESFAILNPLYAWELMHKDAE